jgi:hypothetical protein
MGNAFLLIGAMNVLYILFFMKFVPETKGGFLGNHRGQPDVWEAPA